MAFLCPIKVGDSFCGRVCRTLYTPPRASFLACRQCHKLSYASAQRRSKRLKLADRVFVPDIYYARDSEEDRRSVHALDVVRAAANRGVDISYVENLGDVAEGVLRELRSGDLVVTMGAGSVGEVSRDLAERLRGYDDEVIRA